MYWINKPYVRPAASDVSTPVYVPNETYSFYINSDIPISDPHFYDGPAAPIRVFLLNSAGAQVLQIGIPSTVQVGDPLFGFPVDIYMQFVFPVVLNGQYFFQIYDTFSNIELVRSNMILVNSSPYHVTSKIKFRHSDQLYGVRYDLLPDFYQECRLPVNQIKAVAFESTRTEYRESSNGRNLRRSKSFRDMKLEMEFYLATDEDEQALSAILEHDEVYIDGFRIIDMKQIDTQEKHFASTLSKSTFEILLDEYVMDYSATGGTYGGVIYSGGNPLYLPPVVFQSDLI